MRYFGRTLDYVWPQWHRIVGIVIAVLVISVLYTITFATITPLLTVMMGSEGLYGWVDRKITAGRYGIEFYVPDTIDLSDPNSSAAYKLRVTNVHEKSPAEKAGFEAGDWITAVVKGEESFPGNEKMFTREMLEKFATSQESTVLNIRYNRVEGSAIEKLTTSLQAPEKPFYADTAYKFLSVLPREQSKKVKRDAVIFVIVFMAFVTIFRCIGRFTQNYMTDKVMQIALHGIRRDMFAHAINLPIGYFSKDGPSETVSRLIRDTEISGRGIRILFGKLIREPIKSIGLLVYALSISTQLTLIFLCGIPVILIMVTRLGKKIKRAVRRTLESWALMLGKLQETMAAICTVKVYNRQASEHKAYEKINSKLVKHQLRIAKVEAATGPIMEVCGMIAVSAGLIVGANWVYSNKLEAPEFFSLLIVLSATAEGFRKLSDVWPKFQQANAGAERVFGLIEEPAERSNAGAVAIEPFSREIVFENVSFSYPGGREEVLHGVNLTVHAGQSVAIVGPNGSGKTTMVNLLPRFYDPDSGRILMDGTDLRDIKLDSLRDQMSLVTQTVMNFHDTVANNIAYSRPDASREEVVEAARKAYVHEFIEPLSDGYDTFIGQQGTGFSGGQLQRIAIARAILKNPPILIFDEAMSQVDADSEAKIKDAVEEFMLNRTSIVIAHRFSTVIKADMIVVMHAGTIVDVGPHEHLLQNCELYKSLYETQLMHG